MPDLDAAGLTVGIVATQWNEAIVGRLIEGAQRAIAASGATSVSDVVPGAFELPFGAQSLIRSGSVDAVVVIGAVIRGETTHYELVSEGCAQGVMQVQLATGVPIGMGVLTVENEEQAMARSEPAGGHNVGEEATVAAIEMALLAARHRA
ncbi:6,7-dimethyl-8-ribityllumazine synthase [Ilumatobacter nonamiensis]|uniref:6,7-dimethyl-8-ribityllumazine synthase n=1 Tax=Ilumatobacter nonamiensis TaxID=467093 RepID=UPI000346BBB7|nr:6,7-dimethyl-8-ribityllumazine synthase [Ilumatobacter nonamiensis]